MTSQEVATQTPQQELVASVRSPDFKQQVALALPEGMKPERFVRVMVTALLDNPDLAKADFNSIFQAGLHAAKDGLLPDGREAAFVMFKDKATYMPMIGGFRKIAAEYGWSLRTRVVYANDEFEHVLGLEETITHRPVRPGVERGSLFAAYAVATHKDGRRELEVMYEEDIAKARAVSRAKDKGPWVEWPERMWEKTAGRRLFAKLPFDDSDRRIASVLEADLDPEKAATLVYGPGTAGNGGKAPPAGVIEHKAAPPPEPEAGSDMDEGSSFEAPEAAAMSPDVTAADIAGGFKIPRGKYENKTLRDLYEMGDEGVARIAYVIRNWKDPKDADLNAAALAFVKVYAPEVFLQVTTEAGS
jgi:recombination protein RecT